MFPKIPKNSKKGSDDMLGLILMFGLVYLIGTTFGDDAGVVAISVAILILIVLFCRGWSSTSRAYGNWVRYWDKGVPPEDRGERK